MRWLWHGDSLPREQLCARILSQDLLCQLNGALIDRDALEQNAGRVVTASRMPGLGEFVAARGRTWLVEGVPDPAAGQRAFRFACVDDDAQGEQAEVLWGAEIDPVLRDEEAWAALGARGGDDARAFAATAGTRFILSQGLVSDEAYVGGLRDLLGDFRARSLLILDEAHHAAPSSGGRYAIESQFTASLVRCRRSALRAEHVNHSQ